MLFLTSDIVRVRRKAGYALAGALVAYWLAALPLGPFSFALLLAAFAGTGLGVRWLDLGQKSTRFKFASGILFLALITQVRASVLALRIAFGNEAGYTGDAVLFLLATHLVPIFLLLGLALAQRDILRKRESALIWVGFGLSLALFPVGMGNGAATFRGETTPEEYRQILLAIRAIMLLPVIAAVMFLVVPPRQVISDDEVVRRAEDAAMAATLAAQRAAESQANLAIVIGSPPAGLQSKPDLLSLLDERLARGEISEATYLMLRQKYGPRSSAFERVRAAAIEMLRDPERADEWLNTPNIRLGGRSPMQAIESDGESAEVEALIGRLGHGVY
jgi:putative toxin-antitoxin system antitoxin component (TIGR02293 family)